VSRFAHCDLCQGVSIASSGNSVYAGLGPQLLQYLQDDCQGARRWIWSLEESLATTQAQDNTNSLYWITQSVQQTRQQIKVGLKWHAIDTGRAVVVLHKEKQIVVSFHVHYASGFGDCNDFVPVGDVLIITRRQH
jgi:hypothetical protein